MNKEVIVVTAICGPHCVGPDDGMALFEKMLSILKSGNSVCLDFSSVETLTTSFLNASVGKIFGKFDYADLEARLQLINLDTVDQQSVSLVIKNAKEHFAKNQEIRQSENDIVRKAHEED